MKNTKHYFFKLIIFIFSQTYLLASEYCEKVGDIHHHGPQKICLGHRPNLSTSALDHFFKHHLEEDIKYLSLKHQENITDEHLALLSKLPHAASTISLNLKYTSITYDGIAALWQSALFGSSREEIPIYESYYNLPISIIKIEIAHTPALDQYKEYKAKGKQLFPLPLHGEFKINYIHPTTGVKSKKNGFKQIVLMDHGKPIE